MVPVLTAKRYVQPLREGGSLPAIVDTDDGMYVVKFRGAGQGPKALVAEVITAQVARAIGLAVPDIAVVEISDEFGRSEPDPEIQDLLRASHGTNIGLRYLDGAFNFDAFAAGNFIDAGFAARVVWLDALLTNPDRTHRNPNLLIWNRTPWLIDHGAALYAHHDWSTVDAEKVRTSFPLIKDHVLLTQAAGIESTDGELAAKLTPDVVTAIVAAVPDELLSAPAADRKKYVDYITARVREPREFVAEAVRAKELRLKEPVKRKSARR